MTANPYLLGDRRAVVQGGPGHRYLQTGDQVRRQEEEVRDEGGRDNRPAGDQGKLLFDINAEYRLELWNQVINIENSVRRSRYVNIFVFLGVQCTPIIYFAVYV